MSSERDHLPVCFGCEFDGLKFPCRDDTGHLRIERLIESYLAPSRADEDAGDDYMWAAECIDQLVTDAPEIALKFIVSALPHVTKNSDIAVLAAGPLEDLIVRHGVSVIDEVEHEAERNERFRFLLSGIWGRGRIDPQIWRRIEIAVEPGPGLDDDPRTPYGSAKRTDPD